MDAINSREDPIAFSPKEVGKKCGLGKTTVFKLLKSGRLASVKVGKRRLIPADSVRTMLRVGA